MLDFSNPALWAVGVGAALISGVAKSGVPGLGILAVPLMALVIPAKSSVGALLPILIAADINALALHHRHAEWRQIVRLLPWVAVGMAPAYYALGRLDEQTVRPLLGALVLAMLALELVRRRLAWDRLPHHPAFGAAIGVAAGFATTMGNAAGPLMSLYLLARGLTKERFVGTIAWYFFIVNLSKVPVFAARGMITGRSLLFNLAISPAVVVGAWLGYRFVSRVSPAAFLAVVYILAAAGALWLWIPK